ncbi:MAG: MBL fold metallo-hydrolase [Dehalococcoidales bacterium]|nr:MBL fold metallo-hydrolase [Dehalococcoidales bacterium]
MLTIQVIPNLYQITVRYANIFLIVEEKLTLIDTGFRGSTPCIAECIHKLGRKPEEIGLIILTHNHIDHFGGLAELRKLTGAKVAAPRVDFAVERDILPYPAGNYLGKLLKVPPLTPIRHRLTLQAKDVDILLDGGEVFPALGGLRVVPTPGHTAGSISLYAPQKKLLFVADALNKRHDILRLPLKTATTDLGQTISSIEKMAQLDVDVICFGHGRPIKEDAKGRLSRLAVKVKN